MYIETGWNGTANFMFAVVRLLSQPEPATVPHPPQSSHFPEPVQAEHPMRFGRSYQWAGRVNIGTGTNDKWFCSEFVIACYCAGGVSLTLNPPSWVTPQGIVEIKLNGMLGYVGHLKTSL